VFRTNVTSTYTVFSAAARLGLPHDTLLDIGKARRVLGYAPTFSWRELF
jgi:hypothetical protein